MTKRHTTRLKKAYSRYRANKGQKNVLDFFLSKMPEIVYRTTRLEGEPITRKIVSVLFSTKGRSASG